MEWFEIFNSIWSVLYPILLAAVPVIGVYALKLRKAVNESREAFMAIQVTVDEAIDVLEGFTGTIRIADDGNIQYDSAKLKNAINKEIPELVSSWKKSKKEILEMLASWGNLFKKKNVQ